MDPDSSTII